MVRLFSVCLGLLLLGCSSDKPTPAPIPTDPLTCPAYPGPHAGATCKKAGESCFYAGSGPKTCGSSFVCNGSTWVKQVTPCKVCAAGARCKAGFACGPSPADGTCACAGDGVLACLATTVDSGADGGQPDASSFPACPLAELGDSGMCSFSGQECDYYIGGTSCGPDACQCLGGYWVCQPTTCAGTVGLGPDE